MHQVAGVELLAEKHIFRSPLALHAWALGWRFISEHIAGQYSEPELDLWLVHILDITRIS